MAILKTEDAQRKYAEQIAAVRLFEASVTSLGFHIAKENDFELGEDWQITRDGMPVGWFNWNIPNYITLELGDKVEFSHDYLGNLKKWQWALSECLESLKSVK